MPEAAGAPAPPATTPGEPAEAVTRLPEDVVAALPEELVAALPETVPAAETRRRSVREHGEPWSLRRSLSVLGALAATVALLMVGGGAVALMRLEDARERVISVIDPALRQATTLSAALQDQEAGVRGYAIGRQPDLLDPYEQGRRDEAAALAALAEADLDLADDLAAVRTAAQRWRQEFAEPVIAAVRAGRPAPTEGGAGPALFGEARRASANLAVQLDAASAEARGDLRGAALTLRAVLAGAAVGLVGLFGVLALGLRRVVIRPISALAGEVRRVADGDFDSEVQATGPLEIVELGGDVEAMRRQIVAELAALKAVADRLDEQARDLERSNAELEQFAYVASHDLQEPLRKVASFTQLLERRYKGQLDERADQYIAFAVDGAKRMQVLINDLLAFSRVGRLVREHVEVDSAELVAQALGNLSLVIEETGAEVTVDEDMPRVSGDVSLLAGVFQNLVSNALKFHGDAAPRIHIGVRDADDEWEFRVADRGIGIETEYADRIFVIFQRLHPKDAYPGTGIGLAMCRKIIEYHGGRIWLDTEVSDGTTFRFTLPKLPPPPTPPPEEAASTAETVPDPAEEPETTG